MKTAWIAALLGMLASAPVTALPTDQFFKPRDLQKVSDGKYSVDFIDPGTIKDKKGLRRVYVFTDVKLREPDGTKSYKAYEEYDCNGDRWHAILITAYVGVAGAVSRAVEGKNITTTVGMSGGLPRFSKEWRRIPPGTVPAAVKKAICR